MPDISGVAHLGLTVRDLARSELWYTDVFDLERIFEQRERQFDLVVLRHAPSGMVISLCRHHGSGTARFDETRTGLDHVSFGVPRREDLDQWALRLGELHVAHSAITETPFGAVLVFRDPDHIQLELFCGGATVRRPEGT